MITSIIHIDDYTWCYDQHVLNHIISFSYIYRALSCMSTIHDLCNTCIHWNSYDHEMYTLLRHNSFIYLFFIYLYFLCHHQNILPCSK